MNLRVDMSGRIVKGEQASFNFAPRKEVAEPGARGGKFYRTDKGKVKYGAKPQLSTEQQQQRATRRAAAREHQAEDRRHVPSLPPKIPARVMDKHFSRAQIREKIMPAGWKARKHPEPSGAIPAAAIDVGYVSDYLASQELRRLYFPVLDVRVVVSKLAPGARAMYVSKVSEKHGKIRLIFVDPRSASAEEIAAALAHEAAHALRDLKGRMAGTTAQAARGETEDQGVWRTDPDEVHAERMRRHVMSLKAAEVMAPGSRGGKFHYTRLEAAAGCVQGRSGARMMFAVDMSGRIVKAEQLSLLPGLGGRKVQKPGSRGGKYWIDERGEVQYGDRPLKIKAASPEGLKALTAISGSSVSREALKRGGYRSMLKSSDLHKYGYTVVHWIKPGKSESEILEYMPRLSKLPRVTAASYAEQAAIHRALGAPVGDAGENFAEIEAEHKQPSLGAYARAHKVAYGEYPSPDRQFAPGFDESEIDRWDKAADEHIAKLAEHQVVKYVHPDMPEPRYHVVSRDTHPGPDEWRVTSFDRRGTYTHHTGKTRADAMGQAVDRFEARYTFPVDAAEFEALSRTKDFVDGNRRAHLIMVWNSISPAKLPEGDKARVNHLADRMMGEELDDAEKTADEIMGILQAAGHTFTKAEQIAFGFTQREPVKAPGSKGGKVYVTKTGRIRYGERPKPQTPFQASMAHFWEMRGEPALRDYLNAYERYGASRLEQNRIKPEGETAMEFLLSTLKLKPTWDRGRKIGHTGIGMLSQKNLWPSAEGETLRKTMLAALKAMRAAPGWGSDIFRNIVEGRHWDQASLEGRGDDSGVDEAASDHIEALAAPELALELEEASRKYIEDVIQAPVRAGVSGKWRVNVPADPDAARLMRNRLGAVGAITRTREVHGASVIDIKKIGYGALENQPPSYYRELGDRLTPKRWYVYSSYLRPLDMIGASLPEGAFVRHLSDKRMGDDKPWSRIFSPEPLPGVLAASWQLREEEPVEELVYEQIMGLMREYENHLDTFHYSYQRPSIEKWMENRLEPVSGDVLYQARRDIQEIRYNEALDEVIADPTAFRRANKEMCHGVSKLERELRSGKTEQWKLDMARDECERMSNMRSDALQLVYNRMLGSGRQRLPGVPEKQSNYEALAKMSDFQLRAIDFQAQAWAKKLGENVPADWYMHAVDTVPESNKIRRRIEAVRQ